MILGRKIALASEHEIQPSEAPSVVGGGDIICNLVPTASVIFQCYSDGKGGYYCGDYADMDDVYESCFETE